MNIKEIDDAKLQAAIARFESLNVFTVRSKKYVRSLLGRSLNLLWNFFSEKLFNSNAPRTNNS
jgi:hypothetical protein